MKRLTVVQKRELTALRDTGDFDKCTPKTFNHLYADGLVQSGKNGLEPSEKALKQLP